MTQMRMDDVSPEYKAFVDKFKPKKTTDDCYTPDYIYDVVANHVQQRYGIDLARFVRPFYPGGDYERFDYAPDAVVVDNPPFSILAKICGYYVRRGIGFFLFAPALTMFNRTIDDESITCVCCDASITYANGAVVNTSFLTNLDKSNIAAMSDPELHDAIAAATDRNKKTVALPKYCYPDNVLTAAMLNYMSAHGVRFAVERKHTVFVRELDAQRKCGKSIYGGGLLLSDKAAAEKAAAEKAAAEKAAAEKAAAEKAAAEKADRVAWDLSQREREIIDSLGR